MRTGRTRSHPLPLPWPLPWPLPTRSVDGSGAGGSSCQHQRKQRLRSSSRPQKIENCGKSAPARTRGPWSRGTMSSSARAPCTRCGPSGSTPEHEPVSQETADRNGQAMARQDYVDISLFGTHLHAVLVGGVPLQPAIHKRGVLAHVHGQPLEPRLHLQVRRVQPPLQPVLVRRELVAGAGAPHLSIKRPDQQMRSSCGVDHEDRGRRSHQCDAVAARVGRDWQARRMRI